MPALTSPLGALPRRFRQPRLLIVGCGDVGLRVAARLAPHVRVLALTSTTARRADLRARGLVPLEGNLDHPATLARLAGLAQRVLHLAPPPGDGTDDPRTAALLATLRRRARPLSLVYGSTTGVYGDAGGARFDESRPVRPANARAVRRVAAEDRLRQAGRAGALRTSILRIPGIYAADRAGGTPRERLLRGTPALVREDDVYTNHIHADDLARACIAALWRGRAQRTYHICDDSALRMGDYFDLAADLYGLPRPRRITRAQAQVELSPMLLSFMSESRQLVNTRMKRELRVRLDFSQVADGLRPF